MKNKLSDLNDHLFAQLERLNDEDKTGDALKQEIERSKAITGVAKTVVDNARLVLDAEIAKGDDRIKTVPAMLGLEKNGL